MPTPALIQQIQTLAAAIGVAVPLRIRLGGPDARARVHEEQARHGQRGGGRDQLARAAAAEGGGGGAWVRDLGRAGGAAGHA